MVTKRVLLSISPDPGFKQGKRNIEFLLENFTKAHIFQKINVEFEKEFCKYLYFRF